MRKLEEKLQKHIDLLVKRYPALKINENPAFAKIVIFLLLIFTS